MTYTIHTEYLEHSGGTKFYELVMIQEDSDGPCMLLKRFGKLADRIGGGQVQVSRGNLTACSAEFQKTLDAKLKGKTGQGRYETKSRPEYGLHKRNSQIILGAVLHKYTDEHYPSQHAASIFSYFDLKTEDYAEPSADIDPEDTKPEAPATDASWGSW